MTQTVVITGASAGIARATAPLYARRQANVALLARGKAGLEARPRTSASTAARRWPSRPTSPSTSRSTPPPRQIEDGARPDRRLDQRRVHLGVRALHGDLRRTSSSGSPRSSYLGFVYGTMAALRLHEAARPRDHRPGRVSARRAQHPAAVRVLRGQARHQRLHRVGALRADARGQRRAHHRGADAGRQHPAVLLGPVPAPPRTRSRCRRSTSPSSPPAAWPSPPTIPAASSTGSGTAPRPRSSPKVRRAAAGPLPGPDRLRQPADRRRPGPGARTISGSPSTSRPAPTMARTARSTAGRITAAPSSGSPSTPARSAPRPSPPSRPPGTVLARRSR